MTYYIHPIWFYLMDVCSWVKGIAIFVLVVSVFAIFIEIYVCTDEYGDEIEKYFFNKKNKDKELPQYLIAVKKVFVGTIVTLLISLLLSVTVPTSKTVTKMLIASVITVENVESAKENTKELVDYICEKISEVKDE